MNNLHQLDVLINEAGQSTSDMHDAALQLDGGPRVTELRKAIEAHGAVLARIQAWSNAAKAKEGNGDDAPARKPDAHIPPGEVVDVGSTADQGVYTGPVNEATLTDANRRYIANHVGQFSDKWGQVFNARVRFPSTGGDAMVGEQDPNTPDGFDLSRF